MKRAVFIIILAALVVVTPIAIKFSSDAKRFQHDLAAQADTVLMVRTELATVSDSLNRKMEQLLAMAKKLDSMSQLYAQASTLTSHLSAKVIRISGIVDSLKAVSEKQATQFAEQGVTLSEIRALLADTTEALTNTRSRLDSTSTLVKGCAVLLSEIQPWYAKWKHDARERNWLEKLFGADKAKTPGFPEPVFPNIPVDSLLPGAAARLRTSM